jgi:hypothetical protein
MFGQFSREPVIGDKTLFDAFGESLRDGFSLLRGNVGFLKPFRKFQRV